MRVAVYEPRALTGKEDTIYINILGLDLVFFDLTGQPNNTWVKIK